MRIQFCGADRTVTGSSHLIEVNGLRVFLDMGMYQGRREEERFYNQFLPDNAASVDAIILSHGHLDHCGKLPFIVAAGYDGPIYCTPATADVARVVLLDAAEIQEEDAAYLNRRSRDPGAEKVQPLYTMSDAQTVLKLFRHVRYAQKTDLGNGVAFTFLDAGHILGSAFIVLEWEENGRSRSLLFTGDVGRYHTPILRDPAALPGPFEQIITESTYGTTEHAPMEQVEPQFLEAVKYCVEHRSRLIIPAFAVGRTQTMLWYLQKFVHEGSIPQVPIFVDSPMGVEISRIHQEHTDNYDAETKRLIGENDLFGLARVTFARSSAQSREINSVSGTALIIASSPSCEFGRVLHHLKISLEREHDMIVFVGWTPPRTLGRRLQEGQKRVRVFDRWYDLRCQVRTIHGLSAHADGTELLKFLAPTLRPETTAYVVHGEVDQAEGFSKRLLDAGVGRTVIPAMESSAINI